MKKTSVTKDHIFSWTPARIKGAKLAAGTSMTHAELAKECDVSRETVSRWFQEQEFKKKVEDLILHDERFTQAGLLKISGMVLEKKLEKAAEDKSTAYDYIKLIADIVGIKKPSSEVNIFNAVGVINTQEVKDAAAKLCEKLREADDSTE